MQRHHILTNITVFVLATLLAATPALGAGLTQRDWMITLVDALGWSFGLPDEPQDPDYMNILAGNRELRFEAEDIYNREQDPVSVMAFRNFGDFSGPGWLSGRREATEVHLAFTVPVSGTYQVKANLRQEGHRFQIGDEVVEGSAGNNFTLVTLGAFRLEAGPHQILLVLPPNGALDYLSLAAPNLSLIAPEDGWQPDEPLTWEVVQTTLLQVYDLAELFPVADPPLMIEAESHPQEGTRVVDIPHLGRASGGKWLRCGPHTAKVRLPIAVPESGFYDLTLRVMGRPIEAIINDHHTLVIEANPYLEDHHFSPLFFKKGNNNITLVLPPGGGVDQVTLNRRPTEPSQVKTALGFDPGEPLSVRQLDSLTALLAAFGAKR